MTVVLELASLMMLITVIFRNGPQLVVVLDMIWNILETECSCNQGRESLAFAKQ